MQHIDLKENGESYIFMRALVSTVAGAADMKGFLLFKKLLSSKLFHFGTQRMKSQKNVIIERVGKQKRDPSLCHPQSLKYKFLFFCEREWRFNSHSFIHSMILLKSCRERKKLVFTLVSLSDLPLRCSG